MAGPAQQGVVAAVAEEKASRIAAGSALSATTAPGWSPAHGPGIVRFDALAMVNRQADQVLRVDAAEPWLIHVELQATADPRLDQRMLEYHVLLAGQHTLTVESVVVLLRPATDRQGLSGLVRWALPVFEGVRAMQESATYQAILHEGEARGLANGARLILLRLGEARFGPPDAPTRAALDAISEVERIEALAARLDRAASWGELLSR